jgi:hypothetical protein
MADILNKVNKNLKKDSFLGIALSEALAALKDKYQVDSFLSNISGEEYVKMFAEINENFSSLFADLRRIRSSFLPFELVKEIPDQEGNNLSFEEIVDSEAVLESYENAFFRMLGMPSSADIDEDAKLTYMTSDGARHNDGLNKDRYTAVVLDTRQLGRESRPTVYGDEIFDLIGNRNPIADLEEIGFEKTEELSSILETLSALKGVGDSTSEEAKELARKVVSDVSSEISEDSEEIDASRTRLFNLSGLFGPGQTANAATDRNLLAMLTEALFLLEPSINVQNTSTLFKEYVLKVPDQSVRRLDLANNFWKYSYLLFPPVQDERIAKCINETRKIVAEPFLPNSLRTINTHRMRPTLLEAIIRIRLDVISGTNETYSDSASQPPTSVSSIQKDITFKGVMSQLGLLESLLIARLFTALYGLALDIREKVASMNIVQERTKRIPTKAGEDDPENVASETKQVKSDPELDKYNLIKTVEDSILLLLGDNTSFDTIDLQEGTARSSSVKDAHLMGAVLSSIDIPRRWAESKISEVNTKKDEIAKKADPDRAAIGADLGVAKGVGSIDVLAFTIALFSVPEDILLSLLTDKQFDYMKAEFSDGFFDDYSLEFSMANAVEKVSEAAYEAYELVRLIISTQETAVFMYDD